MARYDFNAQRLFVEADLAEAPTVACSSEQANYLRNVLRLQPGDAILVFNGRDGEWRAELADGRQARRRPARRGAGARRRRAGPDIDYLFAPLKRARLDYMVQKATEMGVARLRPVLTRRTTPSASTSSACAPMPSRRPSSAASCACPRSTSR